MNRNRTINSVVALRVVGIVLLVWGASSMKLLSQSLVRVVNVMRDATEQRIDVYVDSEAVARIVGLGYLGYSEELSLTGGTHEVVIRKAGKPEELTRVSLAVSADSSYTVYVLGSLPQLRVVSRGVGRIIGNDSLVVRCVQVTNPVENLSVTVRDPSNFPGSVIELPLFDSQTKTWGDSIGYWKEKQLVAGRVRVWLGGGGMSEDRPYSGHYREGSVVTFVVVGAYDGGSGDLGVYSIVETETGGGVLHRLREKGVGDGAVRPVSLATDVYTTEYTVDGVLLGYDPKRYSVVQRVDDFLGTLNIKMARRTQIKRDTLIDEDLYVGVDTLTTAILVGNQQVGYSVVSLQTPMLYEVSEARSRLRVFHGGASVGGIEVVLKLNDGSSERFSGLSFKGSSEYREVAYGPVVAELYRSGEQVAFARKRGYLPVDSQMTLMVIGPSKDSLGVALLVDTDSNYQSVKFWPDAGATGVEEEGGEEAATVAVYPNPTNGDLVLTIAGSTNATTTVGLLTLTGREVQTWPAVPLHRHGTTLFPISTAELGSGTYLVRVQIAGEVVTRLITVVK